MGLSTTRKKSLFATPNTLSLRGGFPVFHGSFLEAGAQDEGVCLCFFALSLYNAVKRVRKMES